MGRAALTYVRRKFTWSTVAERTASLYASLLPERLVAHRARPSLPIRLTPDRASQESLRA